MIKLFLLNNDRYLAMLTPKNFSINIFLSKRTTSGTNFFCCFKITNLAPHIYLLCSTSKAHFPTLSHQKMGSLKQRRLLCYPPLPS